MNQGVLAGILRWSLTQGDGLQPDDEVHPMSEEDARFLQEAFESITVDEVQRMKLISSVLSLPDTESELLALTQRSRGFIAELQRVPRGVSEGQSVAVTPSMTRADKKNKQRPWERREAEGGRTEEAKAAAQPDEQQAAGAESDDAIPAGAVDIASLLSEVVARKEGALDELDERVLSLDNALDLHTVGGFPPLLASLRSPHPSVQWRAAQALATVCQNNPKCQRIMHELDALTPLISIIAQPPAASTSVAADAASSSVSLSSSPWQPVTKALYALSSLLRSETPACSDFIQRGGTEALVELLSPPCQPPPRVIAKALSLLRLLVEREGEAVGEVMAKMGVWSVVKGCIGDSELNVREESMRLDRDVQRAAGNEAGHEERGGAD